MPPCCCVIVIGQLHCAHTHPFNVPFSGTTRVSRCQKGKTNLDFTEVRDDEWPWHKLGHMQVCTSLQTDNHASTPPLSFLQAGCPSCRPTNSVKALKATCILLLILCIIVIMTTVLALGPEGLEHIAASELLTLEKRWGQTDRGETTNKCFMLSAVMQPHTAV